MSAVRSLSSGDRSELGTIFLETDIRDGAFDHANAICSSDGSAPSFQIGYDLRLELGWDSDLYPQRRFRSHRMLLSSGDATSLESALELNRYEVGLAGQLNQLRRELRRLPEESRCGTEMLHEVTRVA